MRIRRSIIWLIAVVVVVIAVVLWFGRKRPEASPALISSATNVASQTTAIPTTKGGASVQTNVRPANTPIVVNQPASPPLQGKVAILKEILQANDANIVFYGQLEDQFSNAVSSADISFSVQYEDAKARGIHRGQVVSDANGFFTISGYQGASLTMLPRKAGYTLATTDTSFRYSQLQPGYFVPDANNPVIIKMWKLGSAKPLTAINKTFKLPYTDAPIFFDLLTGKIVPAGGDLEAIVTRAPGVITGRNHGDWSIKLVPVSGGILETDYHTAQVTFEAPAGGYQDNYFVQMKPDDPGWYDNIQKMFFLTSRDGQVYSKLLFDFEINDDPNGLMYFQFRGVASTNGSRNWEATAPQ